MKQPAVYIMANRRNGTLYTGVTSDLVQRVWQHKMGRTGFTARYGCKMLVWYEIHEEMIPAIEREKQIKAGSRRKKLALIESMNPDWTDLYEIIVHCGTVIARSVATKQSSCGRRSSTGLLRFARNDEGGRPCHPVDVHVN